MAQQQAQGAKGCKARGSRKAHCLAYRNRSEGGIVSEGRKIYWSPLAQKVGRVLRSGGAKAAVAFVNGYSGSAAYGALSDIARCGTKAGELAREAKALLSANKKS